MRIGIAAAAVCLASWFVMQALGAGLVDDSFIFLRYAENFASGHGPVFNPGERVEGYSSPLWMVLLTIATALNADPVIAARSLSGILGFSVPVIILVALGRRKIEDFIAALVAASFFATHPSNAFWSWTGMDAALFAALSLLTLALVLRPTRPTPRMAVLAGLAFSLSALARPEALAFLPLYVLYLVVVDPEPAHHRLRIAIWFMAPMSLVAGSFVVRRIYYGAWLPNTYYAKADIDRMVLVSNGAEYLLSFLAANFIPIILFAALFAGALIRREIPRAPWFLLAALVLTAVATTVSLGGDHFPLHRFLLPTLAFIAYGLARGFGEFTRWDPNFLGFRAAILPVAVIVLLGVSNSRLVRQSAPDAQAQVVMAERWSEVGRWFRDNAVPDATMASIVVGAIPYYSELDCIDLLGLTDATVAREGAVYPEGAVGHQRYHTEYVLSRQPTYIVFSQSGLYDEPSYEIGLQHAYALWDILQDSRAANLYDLRTVTMTNGNVILFLELRDLSSNPASFSFLSPGTLMNRRAPTMATSRPLRAIDRRRFVAFLGGFGVAGLAADQLWAAAAQGPITAADIENSARIAGLSFTEDERDLMLEGLDELREDYAEIRTVPLENSISPALHFDPRLPGFEYDSGPRRFRPSRPSTIPAPNDIEELAFLPITQLAQLLRTRKISSVALTKMYIERLKQHDPTLHCVITLTEDRALAQARRADRELAEGRYRGPLHGIPWGAKDLLAVSGYSTTWGATPYKEQRFDEDATVVRRLDEAGAVLVAKLTMGALANGDVWFGGKTRNPWNPKEGSRGSSAGSSAAVAAGLVGFAIGTETRGSILSPCTRCGATGLRPTFGLVSRHGAMALSWSMDKIGPICRSVEDCALVFKAIHGPDGHDETVLDMPFGWDAERDPTRLRVGYLRSAFDAEPSESQREWYEFNKTAVEVVRAMGVDLVPLELPEVPISALGFILRVEAAAAFDEMTRTNLDDTLVRQDPSAWPNRLRTARTVPAVEYIQANRVRRIAMREMARTLEGIDVYLSPTRGDNLRITNLTGHPAVVVPNGFRANGTPTSITFCGNLFRDSEALLLARAYQEATGFHLRHPVL